VNGHRSPVAAEDSGNLRLKCARPLAVLYFDDQRLSSINEIEDILEERNRLGPPGESQLANCRGGGELHARIQAGQSMEVPIVEDDGAPVDTGLTVDLDGKALANGCLYRPEGIFRTPLVVESSVGNGNGNKPSGCRHCANLPHGLTRLVAGKQLDSPGVSATLKTGP
jgi:hypothetical protein